jgi:hypothetical protein
MRLPFLRLRGSLSRPAKWKRLPEYCQAHWRPPVIVFESMSSFPVYCIKYVHTYMMTNVLFYSDRVKVAVDVLRFSYIA